LLNFAGEEVTGPLYEKINNFENAYAKVKSRSGNWGLIDLSGKQILKTSFTEIGQVSENKIAVKAAGSNGWFFVDTTGRTIIKGPFKTVTPFYRGVSFVNYEGKELLIDDQGREIKMKTGQPIFMTEGIIGIVENPLAAEKDKRYFYADEAGNNIFGRYFEEISPFQLGTAKVRRLNEQRAGQVKTKELLGVINTRGVMVVPPKFRNLHLQPDGNIIINPQRYYSLYTKSGNKMLEPVYDMIRFYPKANLVRVEQGEKIGYLSFVDDKLTWVWPLQY